MKSSYTYGKARTEITQLTHAPRKTTGVDKTPLHRAYFIKMRVQDPITGYILSWGVVKQLGRCNIAIDGDGGGKWVHNSLGGKKIHTHTVLPVEFYFDLGFRLYGGKCEIGCCDVTYKTSRSDKSVMGVCQNWTSGLHLMNLAIVTNYLCLVSF